MTEKTIKIKLPSKFEFKFKPISALDLVESINKEDIDILKLINLCSIEPKLVLDNDDKTNLSLDELDSNDAMTIIKVLFNKSGLSDNISAIKTSDLGKIIAFISYTFKLRPSDLLDPSKKLPELTHLFFDFYCSNIVNEALSGKKSNVQKIDKKRKEDLKHMQLEREIGGKNNDH
jgi:hypothetical protein